VAKLGHLRLVAMSGAGGRKDFHLRHARLLDAARVAVVSDEFTNTWVDRACLHMRSQYPFRRALELLSGRPPASVREQDGGRFALPLTRLIL